VIHGNGPAAPAGRRVFYLGLGGIAAGPFNLPVWKSPPLNHKKEPTLPQLYSRETMKVAAALLHQITAFEYQQCLEIAGASGYTWKDQYYAMIYGVGVEFTDTDGVTWQGRRILAKDIQQLLDSISSAVGGILVRTPTGWASLLPANAGDVLTLPPDGSGIPEWDAPSGGSSVGPTFTYEIIPASTQSQSFATVGEMFAPSANLVVTNLTLGLRGTYTGTYRFAIAQFNPSTQKLMEAPVWSAPLTFPTDSSAKYPYIPLAAPKEIDRGNTYLFMVNRTDAGTTGPIGYYISTSPAAAPYMDHPSFGSILRTIANVNPTTADTWSTASGYMTWGVSYYPIASGI
jgi:hypothetical protein